MSKHYYGNGKPVNVYRNQVKLAGYHTETQSGDSVSFDDTYNDSAEVELTGNTVQASDYYAKDGLSSQVQTVQGKNLFDLSRRTLFRYVDSATGILGNSSVSDTSNFIDILPNTAYRLSGCDHMTAQYIVWFTASKAYISSSTAENGIKNSPANAYFCRFSCAQVDSYTAQLELGTSATAYTPFVPNSPSPEYPSPITSNLPAGTYKTTCADGIYEFTLAEELRGIGTSVDKVVFDRKSHRGVLERRNASVFFDGSADEPWFYHSAIESNISFMLTVIPSIGNLWTNQGNGLCNRFVVIPWNGSLTIEKVWRATSSAGIIVNKSRLSTLDVAGFKAWLALNPVTLIYQLAVPTRTPLTFTKVSSSSAPECPMTFLTNTPSLDYPADVVDASGNVLSNGVVVGAFPPLRKVAEVADSYIQKTGKKTKRISDWTTLGGDRIWSIENSTYHVGVHAFRTGISPNAVNRTCKAFKYDSSPLTSIANGYTKDCSVLASNIEYLIVDMLDCGINDSIVSISQSEVKAYFYGWKMCNADGTTPYYKSEVPYNPSTWDEWLKSTGVTGDSTGITISGDGVNWKVIKQNVTVKVSTKYGFLYEVVSSSLVNSLLLSKDFVWASIPKTAGKQKFVKVSAATAINAQVFQTSVATETGSIKLKDIRIFELPAGSQIEADFNNLTADQLAAKYTFNGLCVKNWKHIVGNQAEIDASKTAVLPSASYAGYTPYKMLYQLATPVEESYTPAPVPTHLGQTIIETDSIVKPTINATAKVPD